MTQGDLGTCLCGNTDRNDITLAGGNWLRAVMGDKPVRAFGNIFTLPAPDHSSEPFFSVVDQRREPVNGLSILTLE